MIIGLEFDCCRKVCNNKKKTSGKRAWIGGDGATQAWLICPENIYLASEWIDEEKDPPPFFFLLLSSLSALI